MARSLKVYQGEDLTPVVDLTEPTSPVHVIWEEVEAGGRAFKGESTVSIIPVRDEQGETGSPASLPMGLTFVSLSNGSRIEWLDGPDGDEVRLFRGRIGPKDYTRGRQKADRAREVVINAQDTNQDLHKIIVDDWVRGEESDVTRVTALVTTYLQGTPRASTNIATTYISSDGPVTLPAKTYDGTSPAEILNEIASFANKLFFVTIDDELFYDSYESTAYLAGLRISDRIGEWSTDAVCGGGVQGALGSQCTLDGGEYDVVAAGVTGPKCERVTMTLTQNAPLGTSVVVITGQRGSSASQAGLWDTAGNTWTMVSSHVNPGASGVTSRIWYTNISSPLSIGDTISLDVDTGSGGTGSLERGGKCISASVFSGTISSGVQSGTNDGTISSTPNVTVGAGDLIVAAFAEHGGASGFPDVVTPDPDWTEITGVATGPSSNDTCQIVGGWRLNDADGESWNGTIDQARAWAMVGAVFEFDGFSEGEDGGNLPTFPPIWDVGAASTEDGMGLLSGIRLYYGQAGDYVYVSDATTANEYWNAEESLYTDDPAISDATQATALATSILARRKTEERTYNVSIGPLNRYQIGCLKPGHLIWIKARAIPDADDAFVQRRVAQLRWTTPHPTQFYARMQLDRPLREAPHGIGPKSSMEEIAKHSAGGAETHPALVARSVLTTAGDIPYRGASDWTRLPIGTNGEVLTVVSGLPSWEPDAGGGAGLPWFTVTDAAYGAVGDGATNDTAAINAAIAALISAGRGVLYFPAGTYLTTAALTTLSVPCLVRGDGSNDYDGNSPISLITTTSATANVFTITADHAKFENIAFRNDAASPTNGAAISTQGAHLEQRVDYEGVVVHSFYIGIDIQVGAQWTMHDCFIYDPVLYGVKIRNTVNADAGDWTIANTEISADSRAATAAIRIESSGGGKITGCKINMGFPVDQKFTHGIDVAVTAGITTVILMVTNTSIENVTSHGINVTSASTGQWRHMIFHGNQFGLWSNNTGKAINIAPTNTNDVEDIVISSNVLHTSGTARSAIQLTNTDNVVLVGNLLSGFNALYSSSGATNITEVGVGVSDHGALTGLADDDHTHYLNETRHDALDHTGLPGVGSGSSSDRRILLADGRGTPFGFNDMLQMDDGSDFMWSD